MTLFTDGGVAVITGGASGIGRAAATMFADRGMRLCLFDHNADALAATAAKLPSGTITVAGDVGKRGDLERLCNAAYDAFGKVTVLMNNAAIGGGSESWGALDRWKAILGVN